MGRRIERVTIDGHRTVRRQEPAELIARLERAPVLGTRRIGKFLLVDLEDQTLIIHLRMSGQLLWRPDGWDDALLPHTHARLDLSTGESLHFVDPRTFGELWVTDTDVPELGHLGPDALNDRDEWDLVERMSKRRGAIKTLLLDQTFLAGIGNIYADEILWRARVRSDAVAGDLSAAAIGRIEEAISEVIDEAVRLRGSTLRDRRYVDLMGEPGSAHRMHKAYDREGQPCERCGSAIRRAVLGNRSAYFCPRCQRARRSSRTQ